MRAVETYGRPLIDDPARLADSYMPLTVNIASTDDGVGWRRWGGSAEGATALSVNVV